MGCKQSTTFVGEDTTASRTLESLPDNEKKALATTWRYLKKDHRRHGTMIFVRLFRKHPNYRRYFQDEPGVPMTALASNANVQRHCVAFMQAMGDVVGALTSAKSPALTSSMQRLAFVHKDMPLERIDFDNVSIVFLDYLRSERNLAATDDDIRVWDRVMSLLAQDMCERVDIIKRDALTAQPQNEDAGKEAVSTSGGLLCCGVSRKESSLDVESPAVRAIYQPAQPSVVRLPSVLSISSASGRHGMDIDHIQVPMPKGFEEAGKQEPKSVSFSKQIQVYPAFEYQAGADKKLDPRARRRRWNALCGSAWDRGELPPRVYAELSQDSGQLKTGLRQASLSTSSGNLNTVSGVVSIALAPADARNMVAIWAVMRRDPRATGLNLFLTLYDMYPSTKEKFLKFRQLDSKQLLKDKAFLNHAEGVVKAISSLIDNLGDTPLVIGMLKALAKSHRELQIYQDDFLMLRTVMLVLAEEALEGDWSAEMELSMSRSLDALWEVIFVYLMGPPAKMSGERERELHRMAHSVRPTESLYKDDRLRPVSA